MSSKAFFTTDRVKAYSLMLLVASMTLQVVGLVRSPKSFPALTDFEAFYGAGRLVNERPHALYQPAAQRQMELQLEPDEPEGVSLPFVYTPFFALTFAPFARLPYFGAYCAWLVTSLALFIAGFELVWRATRLPSEWHGAALCLALAFVPFNAYCLLGGQTSAFGFFWLALAFYLDSRGEPVKSGAALAFCLYKPSLLFLILPMLLFTRRWRTIAGFAVTAVALGGISVALVGLQGCRDFVAMLSDFAHAKAQGREHLLWRHVDLQSFWLLLTDHRTASMLTATVAVIVLPLLIFRWLRQTEDAWALAIAWSMVLNIFVPIYDSTLVVLPALMTARHANQMGYRVALILLFAAPWITQYLAGAHHLQVMTISLVVFSVVLTSYAGRVIEEPKLFARPGFQF